MFREETNHVRHQDCQNRCSIKEADKTTYKLYNSYNSDYNSDLDSAGEEQLPPPNGGLELMEVPLSPTHYDQPSTPEHDPPTPWEAESAIHSALAFLKVVSICNYKFFSTSQDQTSHFHKHKGIF